MCQLRPLSCSAVSSTQRLALSGLDSPEVSKIEPHAAHASCRHFVDLALAAPPLACAIPSATSSPCALVRLVYQPHDPRAVVHANRRRRASSPMVERIAQCGESRRGDVGAWERLVALGGGELNDSVLHGENGVAAGDLPLTISAVSGEAIADLNGTENAARRAEHNRSVVFNRALMRAPAQLGASHLRLLAGQVKKHVEPVRA